MNKKVFLLKIDKNIKGAIYKASIEAGKLDHIFKATLVEENILLVDLSIIPENIRKKHCNLPRERKTNLYNSRTRTNIHSFYTIENNQMEFEF